MGPLSRDEFAALVAGGEDSFTEFKDPRTTNGDLAKELCAFANAQGGRVLIGVDDEARIVGADGWDDERIMNLARTILDPPLIPAYQRIQWNNEIVIVVVGVDQGAEKPYSCRSGEMRRYYVRVGSTSREASREELVRLTQASGAVASDLRPVVGATLDDLDLALVAARLEGLRSLDYSSLRDEQQRRVLTDADILHRETGGPTVGGLLCYGGAPQERLPYASVTCVAYASRVVARDLLDRAEAAGRVEQQIERAADFVERNLRASSTIIGLERRERRRPSTESLREVLANAVAHRHYGIRGPTLVRVFSDRLEVASPGGLPNGVTPEAMRLGVSIRRNEFIVRHLERLRIIDAVGRGVFLLYDEAASLELPEPAIDVSETSTQLTLFYEESAPRAI